jgi:hypothetical protein
MLKRKRGQGLKSEFQYFPRNYCCLSGISFEARRLSARKSIWQQRCHENPGIF